MFNENGVFDSLIFVLSTRNFVCIELESFAIYLKAFQDLSIVSYLF